MADAARPRPRPRPKPKANAPSQFQLSERLTASSSTLPAPNPPKTAQAVDDDEKFMRNRRRTNMAWVELEKLTKDTSPITIGSDSDEPMASPRRRKMADDGHIPLWKRDKGVVRFLSAEVSEPDDEDEIQVLTVSAPKANAPVSHKRSRSRSRSRSITPPPAVPEAKVQTARQFVRRKLNIDNRPLSPTILDLDDEEPEDDFESAELAQLAKSIKSRSHSQVRESSADLSDTVSITVKWKPHPQYKVGKEKTWVLKINHNENFRNLFDAISVATSTLPSNLVIRYRGAQVFQSATPSGLRIWSEAEFDACDKATYDYLHMNPRVMMESLATQTPADTVEVLSDSDAAPQAAQPSKDGSDSAGDAFKLVLRSSIVAQSITLTVRPTTKCGAIVRAYLQKAGLADQYPNLSQAPTKGSKGRGRPKGQTKGPRLFIDGEKMGNDIEIGSADLEDGDLVEVVGL